MQKDAGSQQKGNKGENEHSAPSAGDVGHCRENLDYKAQLQKCQNYSNLWQFHLIQLRRAVESDVPFND